MKSYKERERKRGSKKRDFDEKLSWRISLFCTLKPFVRVPDLLHKNRILVKKEKVINKSLNPFTFVSSLTILGDFKRSC